MGVVKVTSLLVETESGLRFSFGVRTQKEVEIWCVQGMCMLKVVSSKKKRIGFEGLLQLFTGHSVQGNH